MISVNLIQTFDGKLHSSKDKAIQHLEVEMGNALLPLAKKIVQSGKYGMTVDILHSEIETMRKIIQINDDMKMDSDYED